MQEPMLSKIPLEIVLYLSNVLGEPPKKIEVVLKSHPHWNQINAANVKDVIDMLTRCNFTPKQIFGGIQLVIYPSNEVAIALRKLNEETKQRCRTERARRLPSIARLGSTVASPQAGHLEGKHNKAQSNLGS